MVSLRSAFPRAVPKAFADFRSILDGLGQIQAERLILPRSGHTALQRWVDSLPIGYSSFTGEFDTPFLTFRSDTDEWVLDIAIQGFGKPKTTYEQLVGIEKQLVIAINAISMLSARGNSPSVDLVQIAGAVFQPEEAFGYLVTVYQSVLDHRLEIDGLKDVVQVEEHDERGQVPFAVEVDGLTVQSSQDPWVVSTGRSNKIAC